MKAEVIELARDYLEALERVQEAARVLKGDFDWHEQKVEELTEATKKLKKSVLADPEDGISQAHLVSLCTALLAEDKPPKAEMMRCEKWDICEKTCELKKPHRKNSICDTLCFCYSKLDVKGCVCVPVLDEMMRCENAVKCGEHCPSKHNISHVKIPQCSHFCHGAVCIPVTEVPNQPKGC